MRYRVTTKDSIEDTVVEADDFEWHMSKPWGLPAAEFVIWLGGIEGTKRVALFTNVTKIVLGVRDEQ